MTAWTILLVVLVGLLALVITQPYLMQGPVEPMATERQEQSVEDGFAGWQTFRSERYGYAVKYPPNLLRLRDPYQEGIWKGTIYAKDVIIHDDVLWLQSSDRSESTEDTLYTYAFREYQLDERLTLDEWFVKISSREAVSSGSATYKEWVLQQEGGVYEQEQIGDHQWLYVKEGTFIHALRAFYIIHPNANIVFQVVSVSGRDPTIRNVLSTIQFFEPDPTANWQTYRNEEYGFEVKYPEDWEVFNLEKVHYGPPDYEIEFDVFSLIFELYNLEEVQKDFWDRVDKSVGFQLSDPNPKHQNLEEYTCLSEREGVDCVTKHIAIDGRDALLTTFTRVEGEGAGNKERNISFFDGSRFFEFYSGYNGIPQNESIRVLADKSFTIDKIASTFRFIESDPTAN